MLSEQATQIVMAVKEIVLKPTAVPLMMFVAGPVLLASAVALHRR